MSEVYIVDIRQDGKGFDVVGPGRGDWRVLATCERMEDAERIADAFTTQPGVPTHASVRAAARGAKQPGTKIYVIEGTK
jgi:hypothetical protein